MFQCVLSLLALALIWTEAAYPAERILVDAKIKGKPLKLILSTGGETILYRPAAERLKLKLSPFEVTPEDEVAIAETEPIVIRYQWASSRVSYSTGSVLVADVPEPLKKASASIDGFVGWKELSRFIIRLDALNGKIEVLSQVPQAALGWTRLQLWKSSKGPSERLLLRYSKAPGQAESLIQVHSTGNEGVVFPPAAWKAWKEEHIDQPTTLFLNYTTGLGLRAVEASWAEQLRLGPLELHGMLVTEALFSGTRHTREEPVLALGWQALKRMDLIIDGINQVAYVRARTEPPPPMEHNRLGAVFLRSMDVSGELIARVAFGSPAWEAGIRDGDVLLKVWGQNAVQETARSQNPYLGFLGGKAWTRVPLVLRRGEETYETIPELRNILPPARLLSKEAVAARQEMTEGSKGKPDTSLSKLTKQWVTTMEIEGFESEPKNLSPNLSWPPLPTRDTEWNAPGSPRVGKLIKAPKKLPMYISLYAYRLRNTLWNKFQDLAGNSKLSYHAGTTRLTFRLYSNGRISDLTEIQNDAGESLGAICRRTVADSAPFRPWPDAMKEDLRADYFAPVAADFKTLQLTFTFELEPRPFRLKGVRRNEVH